MRDPWLDNAKMALVTLVVVGHAWTLVPGGATPVVYDALYAWHVPAFVFITGYLSRTFAYTPARLWMLVRTVAIPYLVFETLLALFRVHVGGERLEDLFADPHWPMWYLSALFFWRLLTPPFAAMAGVVALPLAVLVSLVGGRFAGDTLDLARILGLLPFFVAGLHADPERLSRWTAPARGLLAGGLLLGILAASTHLDRWASTEWLYYRSTYGEMDAGEFEALLIRLGVMAVGVAGAWAFLTLVPRRGGWFTRMGQYTLIVYLGHGFFVLGARYAGIESWTGEYPWLALPIVTAAGVLLALALATRPVARVLQHLVDPWGGAQRRFEHGVRASLVASRLVEDGRDLPVDRLMDMQEIETSGQRR